MKQWNEMSETERRRIDHVAEKLMSEEHQHYETIANKYGDGEADQTRWLYRHKAQDFLTAYDAIRHWEQFISVEAGAER